MTKINKRLALLLLFLTLFNLTLVFYIYVFPYKDILINLKNHIPFIKKEFIIDQYRLLPLNKDKIIFERGDARVPYFGTATFKAYADKLIYFNSNIRSYILPIKIKIKNSNVQANLVLGNKNKIFNIKTVKGGFVSDNQEWTTIKAEDAVKYIKPHTPLIVKMFYDQEVYDLLKKNENCNKKCIKSYNEYKQFSKNAGFLFNDKNKIVNKILEIGPVELLIIYEK